MYLDKIPLPPGKKTFQSVATMGAEMAGVIEQTGKPRGSMKILSDPSLTTKKDQMNKKQAILDELQKVERELQASGNTWACHKNDEIGIFYLWQNF